MGNLLVGMSKADITPKLGCLLYGYPSKRYAERVMDPLSVGVAAFVQDEKKVLLFSAEVCEISTELCDKIRREIAVHTGVEEENILYAATHTHSGPVTKTNPGWGEADEDYINEILLPASVKAARQALCHVRPAVMGIGTVASNAGINRRETAEDGEVILGQNPDGLYDPAMTVVSFKDQEGDYIGSIVHMGIHATSAGENLSVTRDLPGAMIDRIEEMTGADCIFLNGAEGDIGPRLSNGRTTGAGDESFVKEIGRVAASDAERALQSIDRFETPVLRIKTGRILLPFVEPPALEAVEKEMMEMGDPEELTAVNITKYAKLQKIKGIYDQGQEFPKGMELDQTILALGDVVLVFSPFEAFCKIALSLKEQSPYPYTLFVGLTNGAYGYLPAEEQLPYGGYEVDSFRATGILSFVDATDKQVVKENVKLMNQMHQAE